MIGIKIPENKSIKIIALCLQFHNIGAKGLEVIFLEDHKLQIAKIEQGYYTLARFCIALQNAMNKVSKGQSYQVTSSEEGRIRIDSDGDFSMYSNEFLGFRGAGLGIVVAASHMASHPCQLQQKGKHTVGIELIPTRKWSITNTPKIIAMIDVSINNKGEAQYTRSITVDGTDESTLSVAMRDGSASMGANIVRARYTIEDIRKRNYWFVIACLITIAWYVFLFRQG